MKKLLFFLSFIVTCYIGNSQAIVTLKGGQFGVGSLLPVNPFTILGNPTGSIAVPQAYGIGYGLIFQGGKLAVDTTIKDTVFAANGLQWIGPGTRTIGLGGFMAQNTTISGSNLYSLTFDSFPAGINRGIRFNVGNDAGYDLYYRDSATGYLTNLGKGAIGQVVGRPASGGLGWVTIAGGGLLNLTTSGTSGAATLIGTTLNIPVYAAGITTVGAFSGSSIANGASISGTTITFGPADGTNPGMVKPTGTQTFGPTITFTNAPILTTSSTVGYVWTATGTGGQGGWSPASGGGGYSVTTAANTSNYTVPSGRRIFVILSDLTGQANRNAVLPGSPTSGDEAVFKNINTNASTFNWTFTVGTVKDNTNSTITLLTNQVVYHLVFDGTNWDIIN